MASTKIILNPDEIGKAIFEYVERNYPIRALDLVVHTQYGKIKQAVIEGEIKNK